MSVQARPSGIKPPTSRIARPSVSLKPSSNGSTGDAASVASSEDSLGRKKVSIDRTPLLDGDERDQVTDLPSLPGSRRASEQARRLSDGSGNALDAAAYEMARRLSEAGVRRMSDANGTNMALTTDTDSFIIGQRVFVNGTKPGVIQFIGETKFAAGEWAGIVLDDLTGKNDGSVSGHRYFQCQPKKGVFSRLTRLTRQPLSAEQLAIIAAQQQTSENGDESTATSPVPPNIPAPTAASSPIASPSAPSSMVSLPSIGDLRLGDRVIVTSNQGSKTGTLRYLGQTEFALGQWAGVELDEALGKNDGAVAGTRYFDCQPMYGLFAPIHKVSRSPANHMRRTSGSAMNASMTSSVSNRLTRQGTRDSFGGMSDKASVVSMASSRASTAFSRVRPNVIGTPRLLTSNSPASSALRQKPSRPSVGGSTHANLQEVLREKEHHIEQLMKEREMERCEVTRAATQADEAESRLAVLQQKFNQEQATFQAKIEQLERQLAEAESARASMAAQIDDLQFRLEEETIIRGDLEAEKLKGSDDKDKEWARLSEQMEKEAQRCFEAEELAARYKDELDSLKDRQVVDERFGKLEDVVRAKDAEIGQLKDSVAELSRTLESEQHKRHSVEDQFRVVEKDLESARSSLTHAKDAGQQESQNWQAKLESLERQLVEAREHLAKSNDDKSRLESLLTEAKDALVRLRNAGLSESGQLVVRLQEAERVDFENKEKIAELVQEKEKLEFQLAESAVWLEKSNETNQELSDLKLKLNSLQLEATLGKDQLAKLTEEKANLQVKLEELELDLLRTRETSDFEADELKAKIDELEQQITENKQEQNKSTEERLLLEKELHEVEGNLSKSKQVIEVQSSEWKQKSEEFNRQINSLNNEIKSLQSHNRDLESKVHDAQSSLTLTKESSVTELNETKTKLEELQKKFDESRDLMNKLEEEKSKLESELFEARETSAQLEEKNQKESLKLIKITEELKVKSEEIETKSFEIKEMLAQFEAEKAQLVAQFEEKEMAARAEIDEKAKELDELTSKTEASEKRGLELNEQLAKMGDEKDQLEEELRRQMEKDEEMKRKLEDLERQRASSDQKIVQLNEEKARLESEVLKLSSSSNDASQDLTRLHGELMAARQALAESQSIATQTEQARAALEQQLEALRCDLKTREERINELSLQRSDFESRLQSAQKDFTDIDAQLRRERENRDKLEAQFKLDIQKRDDSIVQFSATQAELETQLEAIKNSLSESEARFNEDKANWSQQQEDLKSALSKKDEEIKDLTSSRSALESELCNVKKNLADIESQYEAKREEADSSISSLQADVEARQKDVAELTAVKSELEAKLSEINQNLASNQSQFEREKAELDLLVSNLRSELIENNKRIADLQSAADEYESELSVSKQENARNAELLKAFESNQQESMGSVADLQKAVAVLELEKSNLLNERAKLEDVLSQREAQFSTLSADKEETGKKLQERDEKLAQLVDEVNQLRIKFAAHVSELEQKLEENKKAEETERELQAALHEARARADDLQNALEEARQSQNELFEAQEQLATLSVAHDELNERLRTEREESKKRIEELVAETVAVRERESLLGSELQALKKQVDEHNSRLESQLQATKQEADTVLQLLNDLEAAQKRVKDLESTLKTTNHEMLTKLDDASRRINGLEEQLQRKTTELKEEMDDRDKAEDRCLKLAENLKVKDAEVDSLRQEVNVLKKSSSDVSHLMTAFTAVDKEKKQLEAKVVELQVVAAAASRGAEAKETDTRIKQLKEDNETLQREINFLNSVIVDMQKKVDDLKLKLEVSQATLLGQNILDERGVNGVKSKALAPRLFCDICDMFDLHDTEDCPKQASCDVEDSPPTALLNHDSPSYAQHSRHGGSRIANRPFCENCEIFGHATEDCEETTY